MTQIRVVVVDDDYMIGDIHRRLVERVDGCEVVGVANNGSEAIEMVASLEPDLLLLDIYMPDMSGLDVLRTIRASGAKCDVLVVSAARDQATVRDALGLGSVHFILKPFAPDTLIERLERYVDYRRRLGPGSSREVNQSEIDDAMQLLRPIPTRLPKGLSSVTLGLVRNALTNVPKSGSDIALQAGVSRVSARRYLEHLVEQGVATISHRYGSSGRPENLYRVADIQP